MSDRLWNFKHGGNLKAKSLTKIQHTEGKLLHFVIISNDVPQSNLQSQFLCQK